MALRPHLHADPADQYGELIGRVAQSARSTKTGEHGVAHLGETGDATWRRPDGTDQSIREVDIVSEQARTDLDILHNQTLPKLREDLAAATAEAQTQLDALDQRLNDIVLDGGGSGNFTTYSVNTPGAENKGTGAGDQWWQVVNGEAKGYWSWDGEHWNPVAITDALLGGIDVAKLRASEGHWDEAVVDQLWADIFTAHKITAQEITVGGVTGAALADNAISAVKIADGAVSANKIAANSVSADKLLANAVTADKIATNAVTADAILANSITGDKLKVNTIDASKISGGSFSGKTFDGGLFRGAGFQGGYYATSARPGVDGGVMVDPNNGIRGWNTSGKNTFQLSPTTGEVSLSACLRALNDDNRGVLLIPTTNTGGGGLWFTETGGGDANSAAIWRSAYSPGRYEPLNIRGANGGGVTLYGDLEVKPMGARPKAVFPGTLSNYGGTFEAGTINVNGDLVHQNVPSTSAAANCLIALAPAGKFYRSTSSVRYKKNIVDWNPDRERILALKPRQWQHSDPSQPDEIDERWHVGFVAEEVDALGLKGLVSYSGDGKGGWRPESLNYDRFAAAQQIIIQDHEQRIADLESKNAALEARLARLEAALA